MVGLLLYDYDHNIPGWSLSRFMIDYKFQNKVYGKKSVIEFLDYFKNKVGANKIYISVSIDNYLALNMYKSLGFTKVKEINYSYNGIQFKEIQMVKIL